MRAYAEDKGLTFSQAHAPHGSSFTDEARTEKRFFEIVTSMKNAALPGVKNIVVHPCQHLTFWEEGMPERLFEINMAFYRRLLPYAEEYGIRVCTENMFQGDMQILNVHSTCSRPAEMIRYFDEINHPLFGCCLDIGHTSVVREDAASFIRALGAKRLTCLHVHDVDGMHDNHTLPYFGAVYEWDSHMGEYTGGVNWVRFMKTLAEVGYTGDLTFEADNFLSNFPNDFKPRAVKFMVDTGRYLIGMYDKHLANS